MSLFTAHLCGTFDNAHNFLHIILLYQRGDAYDQFTNYTMTSSITVLVFHEQKTPFLCVYHFIISSETNNQQNIVEKNSEVIFVCNKKDKIEERS